MAGHSKWANIKHKKAATDAKRGKIFTRLIREITVASRMGGGDPSMNPRLRLAVDKATDQNMPKDTIERAVKRGSGGLEGANYEEIRYEGYGVSGAAVIVDCMTDNRTRTVADVRHAFSKYGGNLGTDGSVAFLFKHCGQLVYAPGTDENKLMEAALDAGAEDIVTNDDGSIEVITGPARFRRREGRAREGRIQGGVRRGDDEAGDRSRDDRRGRRADAEAPRRDRVARRRPGSPHQRRLRRISPPWPSRAVALPRAHPRHRPRPAGDRLRRHLGHRQRAHLRDLRLHPQRRGRAARAPAGDPRRSGRSHRAAPADRGRDREGLRQRQSAVDAAAGPGARRGDLRRRARRPAGRRIHGAAGETGGRGPRQGGEGAGAAHGAPVAPAPRRAFPDAADALACAIAHAHGAQGLGGLRKAGYRVRGGRLV